MSSKGWPLLMSAYHVCRQTLCWPQTQIPKLKPAKCNHCGADLAFRWQLMPPLLFVIDEAADWLGIDTAAEPLHHWEWTSAGPASMRSAHIASLHV